MSEPFRTLSSRIERLYDARKPITLSSEPPEARVGKRFASEPDLRCAMTTWIWLATILSLSTLSIVTETVAAEPSAAHAEFFEKEVRPLLVEKCLECHGEEKPKGGLKLTSRANFSRAATAGQQSLLGKPDESLLLKAVRHSDDDLRMPPKEKLSEKQIDVLARWVKLGLPWPSTSATLTPANRQFTITEKQRQFWSFQPVKRVSAPPVRRLVLATIFSRSLHPGEPGGEGTYARPRRPTSARFCAGRPST